MSIRTLVNKRFCSLPVASIAIPKTGENNVKILHRKTRNDLFSSEKERQQKLITKINKIQVDVVGQSKKLNARLVMNKGISTPVDCALHINESLTKYPAVALVNNKPWDMNSPLVEDCQLKFLHYTDADPSLSNQVYWRSCSFILGYILETAFKDQYQVTLHSWPSSNFRSGSFVYDAKIDVDGWLPTQAEFQTLSKIPSQELRSQNLRFEPLQVDLAVAQRIFESNPFKSQQLQYVAKQHDGKIPLYRLGDHVDISRGPMITHTGQLGMYSITALHKFDSDFGTLCRVQGISVPFTQFINSWTWEVLCKTSKDLNKMPLPSRKRYESLCSDHDS